jgi:hypothetical protein
MSPPSLNVERSTCAACNVEFGVNHRCARCQYCIHGCPTNEMYPSTTEMAQNHPISADKLNGLNPDTSLFCASCYVLLLDYTPHGVIVPVGKPAARKSTPKAPPKVTRNPKAPPKVSRNTKAPPKVSRNPPTIPMQTSPTGSAQGTSSRSATRTSPRFSAQGRAKKQRKARNPNCLKEAIEYEYQGKTRFTKDELDDYVLPELLEEQCSGANQLNGLAFLKGTKNAKKDIVYRKIFNCAFYPSCQWRIFVNQHHEEDSYSVWIGANSRACEKLSQMMSRMTMASRHSNAGLIVLNRAMLPPNSFSVFSLASAVSKLARPLPTLVFLSI